MKKPIYAVPSKGLPEQNELHTNRAVFTEAYAVIPKGVQRDIVTSNLPGWENTRSWILARPLSGFAETFAQLIVEVSPNGGTSTGEPEPDGEGVIFVVEGEIDLILNGNSYTLIPGSYVYMSPSSKWQMINHYESRCTFHWIRKSYEYIDGTEEPESFVTHENNVDVITMKNTDNWGTIRFVSPDDMRHDFHVNIVTFNPGGVIPFEETHVMEHGLYVLEGKAVYKLNTDWVEVEEGDFMWLRAFCPQACYASGPNRFRYLLYKDVNRHPSLKL
jgi:(S)-ureidoglycine aminohydrolase